MADRRAGAYGTVAGELVVAADPGGLRWTERGTLRWAGAVRPVARTYLLRRTGTGWEVAFADGRPFHPWRPGERVTHRCRADLYTGLVAATPDRIRTWWDVTGPAKDQRLLTRFARLPG